MKQLRSAFITGFLLLVPILATLQLLIWLVRSLDQQVRTLIPNFLAAKIDFWGSGVAVAIILIVAVGLLTQNLIGIWFANLVDGGIRKITLVGGVYGAIKKVLETILKPGTDQFSGVVLVEFPRKGIFSIGFRTGAPDPKLLAAHKKKELVNIFVPCTPNPTSGFYLLVPEDELDPLDLSVQDAFKIIISMGIVTSEEVTNVKHEPRRRR